MGASGRMMGHRFHISVSLELLAPDEREAALHADASLELLRRAELITNYLTESVHILPGKMQPVCDILEEFVMKHECGCGGDKDADMHEQSLRHLSWVSKS